MLVKLDPATEGGWMPRQPASIADWLGWDPATKCLDRFTRHLRWLVVDPDLLTQVWMVRIQPLRGWIGYLDLPGSLVSLASRPRLMIVDSPPSEARGFDCNARAYDARTRYANARV